MADERLKRDENHVPVGAGITNDANQEIRMLRVDPTTNALEVGGAALDSIAGFNIPKFTQILATYPDTSTEVYTYKDGSTTVGVITVVYSDAVTKSIISSVTKT